MRVHVRAFHDPVDPRGRRESYEVEWVPKGTIWSYVPHDLDPEKTTCVTSQGMFLPDVWDREVEPEEMLQFVQWPQGIGAAVGAFVAGVLEFLIIGGAGPPTAGLAKALAITAKVIAVVVEIGLAVGAGLLANELLGPDEKSSSGVLPTLDEKVHTFEGVSTTARVGTPIPVAFGVHPLGGNILSYNVRGWDPINAPGQPNQSSLEAVIGLCEGPVYGAGGPSEVRFDGNIVNEVNYPSLETIQRYGTLDQDPIPGFADTRVQNPVGEELVNPTSIHQTPPPPSDWIEVDTINAVDRIYANIGHPQGLSKIVNNSYQPVDVHWQYRYKRSDDPDQDNWIGPSSQTQDDLTNRWGGVLNPGPTSFVRVETNSGYPFISTVRIDIPEGRAKYTFQFRRWTQTRPANVRDQITLDSIVEGIDDHFSYPGIALRAIRIPSRSSQSGSIPQVSVTRRWTLTERWNPTSEEWELDDPDHNNPAWIITTILRNTRWGLGAEVDESLLLLDEFYEWAEWCNELVDDGKGGAEKRAVFDGVFEGSEDKWAGLQRVAAAGRGRLIRVGGSIRPHWERPRPVTAQFAMANILEGSFKQQWIEVPRYTRYEVRFLNKDADYQLDTVGVDDRDAVTLGLPPRTKTFDRFGITRPSHALREARYLMNLLKLGKLVEFEAGIDALRVQVGDLMYVSHDIPKWGIASGRLLAVDDGPNRIKLDQDVTLDEGETYEVIVRSETDEIHVQRISSAPGTYLAGEWLEHAGIWLPVGSEPKPGDVYAIGRESIAAQTYAVTDIEIAGELRWKIKGLVYNERIHNDAIDPLSLPVASELPDPFAIPACPVSPPELQERLEPGASGGWQSWLDVSWAYPASSPQPIGGARIYYREVLPEFDDPDGVGGGFTLAGTVDAPVGTFSIPGLRTGGTYRVVVILASPNGEALPPTSCTHTEITIQNSGLIPEAPPDFAAVQMGPLMRFTWDPVDDAAMYEIRRGEGWQASRLVGQVQHPIAEFDGERFAPTGSGSPGIERFHIRAVNAQGLYGPSSETGSVTIAPWYGGAVDLEHDSNTLGWPGTLSGLTVAGDGRLEVTTPDTVGTYETPDLDLGTVRSLIRVGAIIWTTPVGGATWNQTAVPWNQLAQDSFNGPVQPNLWPWSVFPEIKTADSLANLATAPWIPFRTQDWTNVRYVKVRLTLEDSSSWNPRVRDLFISIQEH